MPGLPIEFLKTNGGAAIFERQDKSRIIDRGFEPSTNSV